MGSIEFTEAIDINIEGEVDGIWWMDAIKAAEGAGVGLGKWKREGWLTPTILPEAETAATERLDCRRAFLNIVREGVWREKRWKQMGREINWGLWSGRGKERIMWMGERSELSGCEKVGRKGTSQYIAKPHQTASLSMYYQINVNFYIRNHTWALSCNHCAACACSSIR